MVQQEIFPGAQLCTMGDVTTRFLFDEHKLTNKQLNITMFKNFARPTGEGMKPKNCFENSKQEN